MPKEGYASINISEESANKARNEAQKMGISLVEYFDNLISSAQADQLIHTGLLKAYLMKISYSLIDTDRMALDTNKDAWKYLNSIKKVPNEINGDELFIGYFTLVETTNELLEQGIKPFETLLWPLIGMLFQDSVNSLEEYRNESVPLIQKITKPFRSYEGVWTANIEELVKKLRDIITNANQLKQLFPEDHEVQRLCAAMQPYIKSIEVKIELLDKWLHKTNKALPGDHNP